MTPELPREVHALVSTLWDLLGERGAFQAVAERLEIAAAEVEDLYWSQVLLKGHVMPTCTEPDCDAPTNARGLCMMHYRRAENAGTLPPKTPRAIKPLICRHCGTADLATPTQLTRRLCRACAHVQRPAPAWANALRCPSCQAGMAIQVHPLGETRMRYCRYCEWSEIVPRE